MKKTREQVNAQFYIWSPVENLHIPYTGLLMLKNGRGSHQIKDVISSSYVGEDNFPVHLHCGPI